MKRSLNVGILGLGGMGSAIAWNVAFKSRTAVYLQLCGANYAGMKKMCDQFWEDGAQVAIRMHTDVQTLSKWSDVIMVTLPRGTEYDTMLDRDNGFVNYVREGQIIVDHTAFDYDNVMEFQERVGQKGGIYLDAPLSGNVAQAKSGQLTVMVGGEEAAYNKILPLLRLYGDNVSWMGGVGSGTAAKQIVQQLVAIHTVAAAEAMTLSHNMGISNHAKLLQVLDASWGSSMMLRRNAPFMERLLRNPDDTPPDGPNTTEMLCKDVNTVLKSVSGTVGLPLTTIARDVLQKTCDGGCGKSDFGSVVHFLKAVEQPSSTTASSRGNVGDGKKKQLKKKRKLWRKSSSVISVQQVPSESALTTPGGMHPAHEVY